MLTGLHVKNIAIIDEIWLDLGRGLNVLTGETGAGKSILIGSVNAALGGRLSKDMMGSYADYSLIELVFEGDMSGLKPLFEKYELEADADQVVITRRINAGGRSICRINGETVTATALKEFASELIDIYGQHEHQSLLYKNGQREIIDSASADITHAAAEVALCYKAYESANEALTEAENTGRKTARELDLLRHEAGEIKAAALKPGEDEELEERFKVLENAEKITAEIGSALDYLTGAQYSAVSGVDSALRALTKAAGFDPGLEETAEKLALVSESLSDIEAELNDRAEELSGGAEEYETVGERLDVINRMKSKYGNTVSEIIAYGDECAKKLDEYEDFDGLIERLEKERDDKEEELKMACGALHKLRKNAADSLAAKVNEALKELNFSDAVFEIALEPLDRYSAHGSEDVVFYLSANKGEPLKELSNSASGGELSRIMLAIKSSLAGTIDSLIFDEIDTGISGRTAQKVAEKMAVLSKSHQVICITHLPQLAAMADEHFLIEKHSDGERTKTEVTGLDEKASVGELARMLSGAETTDSVMKNAGEMKELANIYKKGL